MTKKRGFGELELSILEIIRKKQRVSVKEAHQSLSGSNSYTTVMTVMSRLFEKGVLAREKVGKLYEYWLSPQSENADMNLVQRIKKRVFQGKSSAMISFLLENDDEICRSELEEIEKIIKAARGKK